MEKDKVICTECDSIYNLRDVDKVNDPKSDVVWSVCPKCRFPEHIIFLCDEDGCKNRVDCGTPTKDGYRSTCSKHTPESV